MLDLIIENGTVVNSDDTFLANIGICDGKIACLGKDLPAAKRVIDACGKLVLPGGIDSHVHISQPSSDGTTTVDDFESATRSAAIGGNTTLIPFCLQRKGVGLRVALDGYNALAKGNCYVDVSFHLIVTDPTAAVLGQELPALIRSGFTSLKVFMTYKDLVLDDYKILQVMEVAREHGALVMVHAENNDAIEFLTRKLEGEGQFSPSYHAKSRPIPVEREAAHRALSLAEISEIPLMIVHVSNRQTIEEIARTRARGQIVFGETCPQYLLLTEDDLDRTGMEGAKFVCSPPPRDIESQAACWEGLQDGTFDVFSSDHCPYRYVDKAGAQDGVTPVFRNVPNGIPGIATRMPLLFSEGVVKGRISLQRFVQLTSTNHAKIYGLYPRKGLIAAGSDADIVVWDPNRIVSITHSRLKDACDYTPYEGVTVTGWPEVTVSGGNVVMLNGDITGGKDGKILQRHYVHA